MEILGIGASELAFIIIIALLVLGPKDMQKAGKNIGKWLRDLVTSDGWKVFQQTSREIRNLPTRLMREANEDLAKINKDISKAVEFKDTRLTGLTAPPRSISTEQINPPASNPSPSLPPSNEPENSTQSMPPSAKTEEVSSTENSTSNSHD